MSYTIPVLRAPPPSAVLIVLCRCQLDSLYKKKKREWNLLSYVFLLFFFSVSKSVHIRTLRFLKKMLRRINCFFIFTRQSNWYWSVELLISVQARRPPSTSYVSFETCRIVSLVKDLVSQREPLYRTIFILKMRQFSSPREVMLLNWQLKKRGEIIFKLPPALKSISRDVKRFRGILSIVGVVSESF